MPAAPAPPDAVVALVDELIAAAGASRATDVHFEPLDDRVSVRFRVDALLHEVRSLPVEIAPNIAARLKVLAHLLTYRTDVPQEGAIAAGPGRPRDIRVATFPTVRGERVVLRLLPSADALRELVQLGHAPALVERLRELLRQPDGLILVCGPAGSGKTTTVYAMLAHLLRERAGRSVLSVEDPVEIRLPGVTQVEVAPARGFTLPVALRSLLRQDPQILLVGEVRDAQTAAIVAEAALTGHLLLSTIHATAPAEALVRLREMGIAPWQLTSGVRAVLGQRLVRTICPACGGEERGDPQRAGCANCLGSGYAGRTAVGELLEMSAALRAALIAGADSAALASAAGAASLRGDAQRLLAAGCTTQEELTRVLGAARTEC